MKNDMTPLPVDMYGYAIIEDSTEGRAGARFKSRDTTLKLRRVMNDGRDQVQISIKVENNHGNGVTRRMDSEVTLTKEQFDFLKNYLSRHWEPERK